nr:hypothetical protein [Gemmatimonadota bacterium]
MRDARRAVLSLILLLSGAPGAGSVGAGASANAQQQDGADPLALVEQGESRLEAGDAAGALAAFERAAGEIGKLLLYEKADPDDWGDADRRIAAGLARAYLLVGETYLARNEALRALNVQPEDAGLQALLGESYYREGRFAQADSAFSRAVRIDPALGAAHHGRGLLDLSSNRLASARERFAHAYRLDHDPRSLWSLARIAFVSRDYGEAAKRLREYLDESRGLPQE